MGKLEPVSYTHLDVYKRQALSNDIDMIWSGARTSANPFAVQEIADSLEGVDIPVLIKNPVNPDLDLWIGAIERIHNAGIRTVSYTHLDVYKRQTQYLGIKDGSFYNESKIKNINTRIKELSFLQTSYPWKVNFTSTKTTLNLYLKSKSANLSLIHI